MTPGLIFDLDDTLYPERQFIRSGFAAVAADVERRFGVPRRAALATLIGALRRKERGQALQAMCRAHQLSADLVPGLVDIIRGHAPRLRLPDANARVLHDARARGFRLGVLTNGMPAVQARKAAALGIAALVDEVVFAEDWGSGRGKPEPESFEVLLARLRVPACASVFVGDDPWCDIFGARRAGMRTILVCRDLPRAGRSRGCQADRVVGDLADVPDIATSLLCREAANAA